MRADWTTRTVSGAAASARNDAWEDDDRPDIADCVDTTPTRGPGKGCGVSWLKWHDTTAEADAHGCWNKPERCRWVNDKCQHGEHIDSPLTEFDEPAKRFTCVVVQSRRPQ